MQSEILARYLTRSGLTGLEVIRIGSSYRYTGMWGAGCGSNVEEVRERVLSILSHRRNVRVVKAFE